MVGPCSWSGDGCNLVLDGVARPQNDHGVLGGAPGPWPPAGEAGGGGRSQESILPAAALPGHCCTYPGDIKTLLL